MHLKMCKVKPESICEWFQILKMTNFVFVLVLIVIVNIGSYIFVMMNYRLNERWVDGYCMADIEMDGCTSDVFLVLIVIFGWCLLNHWRRLVAETFDCPLLCCEIKINLLVIKKKIQCVCGSFIWKWWFFFVMMNYRLNKQWMDEWIQ